MHEFPEAMQSRLASGRAYMAVQIQNQYIWDWGKRNGLQSIKKDKKKKKAEKQFHKNQSSTSCKMPESSKGTALHSNTFEGSGKKKERRKINKKTKLKTKQDNLSLKTVYK